MAVEPMAILILGSADDDHAAHMHQILRTRGADAEFLDSARFPAETQLAFEPATGDGEIVLPDGRRLKLDEVTAVYWRCYGGAAEPELPDAEQAYIAQNDARSLFESLLIHLPTRWVNGFRAYQLHQTKPVQLAMVAKLGILVPATLLTNDPQAVRRFAAEYPRAIFKPVQGGAHTRCVTEAHLTDENLASLSVAPVTQRRDRCQSQRGAAQGRPSSTS